jgi:hypothetical protein
MTIASELNTLAQAKSDIKTALTNKGADLSSTPFTDYGTVIDNLSTGGGTPEFPGTWTSEWADSVWDAISYDANWTPLPALNTNASEIYFRVAIDPNDSKPQTMSFVGGFQTSVVTPFMDYIIDWGDGSSSAITVDPNTGVCTNGALNLTHTFNEASANLKDSGDGDGIKHAFVHVYPSTPGVNYALNIHGTFTNVLEIQWSGGHIDTKKPSIGYLSNFILEIPDCKTLSIYGSYIGHGNYYNRDYLTSVEKIKYYGNATSVSLPSTSELRLPNVKVIDISNSDGRDIYNWEFPSLIAIKNEPSTGTGLFYIGTNSHLRSNTLVAYSGGTVNIHGRTALDINTTIGTPLSINYFGAPDTVNLPTSTSSLTLFSDTPSNITTFSSPSLDNQHFYDYNNVHVNRNLNSLTLGSQNFVKTGLTADSGLAIGTMVLSNVNADSISIDASLQNFQCSSVNFAQNISIGDVSEYFYTRGLTCENFTLNSMVSSNTFEIENSSSSLPSTISNFTVTGDFKPYALTMDGTYYTGSPINWAVGGDVDITAYQIRGDYGDSFRDFLVDAFFESTAPNQFYGQNTYTDSYNINTGLTYTYSGNTVDVTEFGTSRSREKTLGMFYGTTNTALPKVETTVALSNRNTVVDTNSKITPIAGAEVIVDKLTDPIQQVIASYPNFRRTAGLAPINSSVDVQIQVVDELGSRSLLYTTDNWLTFEDYTPNLSSYPGVFVDAKQYNDTIVVATLDSVNGTCYLYRTTDGNLNNLTLFKTVDKSGSFDTARLSMIPSGLMTTVIFIPSFRTKVDSSIGIELEYSVRRMSDGSEYTSGVFKVRDYNYSPTSGATQIELLDIEGTHANSYVYSNYDQLGIYYYYAEYDNSNDSRKHLETVRWQYGSPQEVRRITLDNNWITQDPYDFVMSGIGHVYRGTQAALTTRIGHSTQYGFIGARYLSSSIYSTASNANSSMYTLCELNTHNSYPYYMNSTVYDHQNQYSICQAYNYNSYYTDTLNPSNPTNSTGRILFHNSAYSSERNNNISQYATMNSSFQIVGETSTVSYEYGDLPKRMFVVNPSGNTFQLSTTRGGAPYTFPSGGASDYKLILRPIPRVHSYVETSAYDVTFTFTCNVENIGTLTYIEPSPVALAYTLKDYGLFSTVSR